MENSWEYKYKVTEIFKSISGESAYAGLPTVFIRLYGCDLDCSWCDSDYSRKDNHYIELTENEILEEIRNLYPVQHIIITGGEPFVEPRLSNLICKILDETTETVEVETNGMHDVVKEFIHSTAMSMLPVSTTMKFLTRLTFTVDYKCPSSGMNSRMPDIVTFSKQIRALSYLVNTRVKLVVDGEISDMQIARDVCYELSKQKLQLSNLVYISPVFGADLPKIITDMLNDPMFSSCRFQLQLHKYVWDPKERGV